MAFLAPVETVDPDRLAPLQQRLSSLKKPKGLKKRKGSSVKYRYLCRFLPALGRGGVGVASDLLDSNGRRFPQVPTFPTWQSTSLTS